MLSVVSWRRLPIKEALGRLNKCASYPSSTRLLITTSSSRYALQKTASSRFTAAHSLRSVLFQAPCDRDCLHLPITNNTAQPELAKTTTTMITSPTMSCCMHPCSHRPTHPCGATRPEHITTYLPRRPETVGALLGLLFHTRSHTSTARLPASTRHATSFCSSLLFTHARESVGNPCP